MTDLDRLTDKVRDLLLDMGTGDTSPEEYDSAMSDLDALVEHARTLERDVRADRYEKALRIAAFENHNRETTTQHVIARAALGAGEGGRDFTRPDFAQALAWERLAREAASLGAQFARFKLALDDYGLIAHGADAALGEDTP
jgi:hypothetical protein